MCKRFYIWIEIRNYVRFSYYNFDFFNDKIEQIIDKTLRCLIEEKWKDGLFIKKYFANLIIE